MASNLAKRCSKIKLVITDVDGVLTDGGMYYTSNGDIMKRFHVRDGMGVTLLRKKNIPTVIVTKEKTDMVKQWAQRMKIKKLYDGIIDKGIVLEKICKTFNVSAEEIAYIGDDVNDLPLLKRVGLAGVPNDAIKDAKEVSHYICKCKSGNGAFREFAEVILADKS